MATTPERLIGAFAGVGPVRVLLETGTESEWVAQALEAAGYTVIVADPNYAPLYGELRRRVKTDRRDAAALAATVGPRLRTVPGVGVVVGLTFRALVDDVQRFARAAQVSAAIGLVPREDSSAERRHRGHISKAGPRELRSLLVQAAWACWRSHGSATLRAWVERLAARSRGSPRPPYAAARCAASNAV